MLKRVESKVYAATVGSGAGATISAFILWALGVLAWGAPADAGSAADAVAAVPVPVSGIIGLTLTAAGAAVAGYMADHTDRDDLIDTEQAPE